jgi:hypothetical protein
VPAWRHALINYPHPLLQRGLVVLDTPGLNAIGAEPELTLALLPSAHATVFILGADAGVTQSDLAIWREHLGGQALERFVVLNKIDALADPLATADEVRTQIDRQCTQTAATLGLPPTRVFPLSAREALAARVTGDDARLQASRLPAFEAALAAELLPRQAELLARGAQQAVRAWREAALRRLSDQRRQNAEQMLELRGLRGKSGAKVRLMLARVRGRGGRLRTLHGAPGGAALRCMPGMQAQTPRSGCRARPCGPRSRNAGGRRRRDRPRHGQGLPTAVRAPACGVIAAAEAGAAEMHQMLEASFRAAQRRLRLRLRLTPAPPLTAGRRAGPDRQSYGRYVGFSQAWRLAVPGFAEQFRRMLLSKLRVVFEGAAGEIELWSKAASAQVDGAAARAPPGLPAPARGARAHPGRDRRTGGGASPRSTSHDEHLRALQQRLSGGWRARRWQRGRLTVDATTRELPCGGDAA